MFGLSTLPKGLNQVLGYVLLASYMGFSTYIALKISTAIISIELNNQGFKHRWIKNFLFSREADIYLEWNQIQEYFFEDDRTYVKFQMRLPNNQRYRIYKQTIWSAKDDFDRFRSAFPRLIHNFEAAHEQDIVLGKTIYEEPGFRWILVVLSAGVVLLLVSAIVSGSNTTNVGTLGMLAAAVAFYWIKVSGKKN